MQKKEKVPVAAVCASLGGTMTSTWLPEEEASAISDIPYINAENYPNTSEPSKCYNGMIAPLADYAFKGVLWYQGENQTQKQEELLSGVICGWRRAFEDSGLPFLVIELPRYEVKEEPTRLKMFGCAVPLIRETERIYILPIRKLWRFDARLSAAMLSTVKIFIRGRRLLIVKSATEKSF